MRKVCLFLLLLYSGCLEKSKPVTKVLNGDTLITAAYIKGKLEGEVAYSIGDKVISRFNYKNGLKSGVAVHYYLNNGIKDSAFYLNDKQNGDCFIFDTSGKLQLKYHYLDGTLIGPMFEYKNGVLNKYGFISFDKEQIINSKYDTAGNWIQSEGQFNTAKSYKLLKEGYTGLFIYFPSPPGLDFRYSFGLFNEKTKEIKKISDLESDRVFLDTLLSKPEIGWHYYVSVQYLDSVANKVYQKMKVLIKEN